VNHDPVMYPDHGRRRRATRGARAILEVGPGEASAAPSPVAIEDAIRDVDRRDGNASTCVPDALPE